MVRVKKCLIILAIAGFVIAGQVPRPEKILGFVPGQDFKLAKWSQIEAYFKALAQASPKVKLKYLGRSTLGRPFFMAIISSPENLKNLERVKEINKILHEGRELSEEELSRLVKEGKAVVAITCSIHSTEVASTLMATELAYKLVTDPSCFSVLENVVLLLFPSLNPDGIDIVYDWYSAILNTPYEASYPVQLYHYYAGHDNNRDWFMGNLKETRMVLPVYYREFFPQVIYDVHQMGKSGVRFFFPPYRDPINPNIDPLLLREINLIGAEVARKLTEAGKKGVVSGALFDSWYMSANRACPLRHNVISILSEAASVNYASPIFIQPGQLRFWRGIKGNFIQAAMLEPWEGGWWRIKDIIDYELIAAVTILKKVAAEKEYYLKNFHRLAARQRQKGLSSPPYAYVIPRKQKDPAAVRRLLETFLLQGVAVEEAAEDFVAGGVNYRKGDFVVSLSQPYRAFIKDLLEVKRFPRIKEDEKYIYPYDEAAWSLGIQMGVKTVEVREKFSYKGRLLDFKSLPEGRIYGKGKYIFLKLSSPYAFKVLNCGLKRGVEAYFVKTAGEDGVLLGRIRECEQLAVKLGLDVRRTSQKTGRLSRIRPLRIAIYQPYFPVHSEGWTRFVLDKFGFKYRVVHNDFIRAGDLKRSIDVLIIPDIPPQRLLDGRNDVPADYRGGIGEDGSLAIEEFVLAGGKLVTYGRASLWAIQRFGLKVKDSRNKGKEKFSSPGSLLVVNVNGKSELSRGYGNKAIVFYDEQPVFEVKEGISVLTLPSYYPVISGIAFNSQIVAGKSLLVEVKRGKGKVFLYGFKVVNRAQSLSTFNFLFNALFN